MSHLLFPLCLICMCLMPAFGDVRLYTSIRDVYVSGDDELAGAVSFGITDNEFTDADDRAIYLRLTFSHHIAFSRTLVDPLTSGPINLTASLSGAGGPGVGLDMLPTDIQLVRAVAGERSFWIRVNRSSDTWVDTDGDGVGDAPPSAQYPVEFYIGLEAGIINTGDTRLWLDVANNGCGTLAPNTLVGLDPIAVSFSVPAGSTGTPEAAAHEHYADDCTYAATVDPSLMSIEPVSFSADFEIGRGVTTPSIGIEIYAAGTVSTGSEIEIIGNLSGHVQSATVHWNFGEEEKRQEDFGNRITHVFTQPGAFEVTATVTGVDGITGTAVKTITVVGSPTPAPHTVHLPHLTDPAGDFTTELIIENRTSTQQTFRIQAYRADGQVLPEVEDVLEAGDSGARVWRADAAALLGAQAAYCAVTGDVVVSVAYRVDTAAGSPAHVAAVDNAAEAWSLQAGDWQYVWDGLALVNAGTDTATVSVTHYDDAGQVLETVSLGSLAAGAKLLKPLDGTDFSDASGTFVLRATQPLHVVSLRGTRPGAGAALMWENHADATEP